MKEQNNQFEYVLSEPLKEAITVAEITQRPLLIKGEPGTGKSLLAQYIAGQKGCPFFQWHIKSTTKAKDGLYFYDALTRLNDSRFENDLKNVSDIRSYIRMEPMGQAFQSADASVLLIDEIDKADIEFPNDLLLELDKMEFFIGETGEHIKARHRPFVIITSNNEKDLPDAFLRRCVFHYIEFPDMEMMSRIVKNHFPDISQDLLQHALSVFYQIRKNDDLKKRPSTSELIDWIQILLHQGAVPIDSSGNINFLAPLIKHEQDLKFFRS